jgi:transcriptional regulator with XRE-family HTH domain
LLQNPAVRALWEARREARELSHSLLAARARSGLTQAEIAERMGTTQSAVARLEGGKAKPSLRTLEKFAAATGSRLVVTLEPSELEPKP